MKRATALGLFSACGLALSALGQTRVIPQCHAWVRPEVTTEDPSVMTPTVTVHWQADRPGDPDWNYECLTTGALAAAYVISQLQDAAWITGQGSTPQNNLLNHWFFRHGDVR